MGSETGFEPRVVVAREMLNLKETVGEVSVPVKSSPAVKHQALVQTALTEGVGREFDTVAGLVANTGLSPKEVEIALRALTRRKVVVAGFKLASGE